MLRIISYMICFNISSKVVHLFSAPTCNESQRLINHKCHWDRSVNPKVFDLLGCYHERKMSVCDRERASTPRNDRCQKKCQKPSKVSRHFRRTQTEKGLAPKIYKTEIQYDVCCKCLIKVIGRIYAIPSCIWSFPVK